MYEGTWTIRPCPHRQSSALARELGVSEITASVLVRRGYGDPEEAKAFLAGEQRLHDPFLLGDMATAVERIRAAIAGGRRMSTDDLTLVLLQSSSQQAPTQRHIPGVLLQA